MCETPCRRKGQETHEVGSQRPESESSRGNKKDSAPPLGLAKGTTDTAPQQEQRHSRREPEKKQDEESAAMQEILDGWGLASSRQFYLFDDHIVTSRVRILPSRGPDVTTLIVAGVHRILGTRRSYSPIFGRPSPSSSLMSAIWSAFRPASIFARSPTTTHTRRPGVTSFDTAVETSAAVTLRTRWAKVV